MSKRTIDDKVALDQLTRLWLFDRKDQRDTLWGFLLALTGLGAISDSDINLLISVYFGRCQMEVKKITIKKTTSCGTTEGAIPGSFLRLRKWQVPACP